MDSLSAVQLSDYRAIRLFADLLRQHLRSPDQPRGAMARGRIQVPLGANEQFLEDADFLCAQAFASVVIDLTDHGRQRRRKLAPTRGEVHGAFSTIMLRALGADQPRTLQTLHGNDRGRPLSTDAASQFA